MSSELIETIPNGLVELGHRYRRNWVPHWRQ